MLSDQSKSHLDEANSPIAGDKEEDCPLAHAPMIPLTELCTHFPDLPSFVHHPDFDHFAYCWMEFQYHMAMSQHTACRPGVKAWLVSMSVKLSELIAKYPSHSQDTEEASTAHIKSAYQRLAHRLGVFHKLLDMIDHGSTVSNQSPQEIVLPVYNALLEYKLDQQRYPSDSFPLTSPSSSSGTSTPVVQLSLLSLSPATSSFRSLACMEVAPYLNDTPSPHIHPMSLVLPSPTHFVRAPGYHHQPWSMPVTPTTTDPTPTAVFWSSSPSSPVNPNHSLSTPRSISQEEEDEPKTSIHNDDLSSEQDDDDDDYRPPKNKKPPIRRRTRRRRHVSAGSPTKRTRGRTATSYDQTTTHFLKSMFFNVYSQRDKLTKEQRRQVVERTGLKPRNVTYWFSNHKRRFQADLDVFRKLMAESDGQIQTYDDYVVWRREHGLPEIMVGDNDM